MSGKYLNTATEEARTRHEKNVGLVNSGYHNLLDGSIADGAFCKDSI